MAMAHSYSPRGGGPSSCRGSAPLPSPLFLSFFSPFFPCPQACTWLKRQHHGHYDTRTPTTRKAQMEAALNFQKVKSASNFLKIYRIELSLRKPEEPQRSLCKRPVHGASAGDPKQESEPVLSIQALRSPCASTTCLDEGTVLLFLQYLHGFPNQKKKKKVICPQA